MSGQMICRSPSVPPLEAPSSRRFRDVVGQFATGVTVVTVASEDQVRGMTANAFTAVSLDPLLVLVCLRLGCATDELMSGAAHFAISILSAEQQSVAAWFADPTRPAGRRQLERVAWTPGRTTGTPLVDGALGWLECAVEQRVVVGDHSVIYGRVLDLDLDLSASGDPLLFHQGRFATIPEPEERRAAS